MGICPKCGKEYSERPGMSRIDNSPICRACSEKEAVWIAMAAGALKPEQAEIILNELDDLNKK